MGTFTRARVLRAHHHSDLEVRGDRKYGTKIDLTGGLVIDRIVSKGDVVGMSY